MRNSIKSIALILAVTVFCGICGAMVFAEGVTAATQRIGMKYDYDDHAGRDSSDVILLLRKIDGWQDEVMTNADADVSGDGKVNLYDAICLMKRIIGDEYDAEKSLKIVSFNIKHGSLAGLDAVAELLKEVDGDIVGLQEIDMYNSRSGLTVNQMEYLANAAGYPYWAFTKAIDYKEGEYGHGILSKYDITSEMVIDPNPQTETEEHRTIGRFEIDVDGKTIAFYNAHLDFTQGRAQYAEAQNEYMVNDQYAIFVGDFNETMAEMVDYYNNEKFYSFGFGDNMDTPIMRVSSSTGKTVQVIDQFIVSRDTISWYDDEVQNGYYVVPHGGVSDHNLIYGYISLKDYE